MEHNIYRILFFPALVSALTTSVLSTPVNKSNGKTEINSIQPENNISSHPYNKNLTDPFPVLPELIFGVDNAPATVIVYLSFTCTYCKKFFINELPKLKQAADKGEIKIIIRPFIDTNLSQEATAIIKCLCNNSKENNNPKENNNLEENNNPKENNNLEENNNLKENNHSQKLEKLFRLAFKWQKDLMEIKTEDDLYRFLQKILPQEHISHEFIANYKKNQKVYSGIMIDHYKTTYNSEISSAPALLISTNNKISIYQGFLTSDEIIQKIAQLNNHTKNKNTTIEK